MSNAPAPLEVPMFRLAVAFLTVLLMVGPSVAEAQAFKRDGDFEKILIRLDRQLSYLPGLAYDERYITPTYEFVSKRTVQQFATKIAIVLENRTKAGNPASAEELGELLSYAVSFGLADLVEEVLRYPGARDQVDSALDSGFHLWAWATLAPGQSSRLCGDGHFDAIFQIYQGYFGIDPAQSPYKTIREMLEKAGAVPRPEEARALWLRRCNPNNAFYDSVSKEIKGPVEYVPGVRDRVANAPDILEAILAEIQAQVKPQGLPKPRF